MVLFMLKKIITLTILSLMTSICYATEKNTVDVTLEFDLPADMKDCKIYRMNNSGFGAVFLYVTRCPSGKTETTRLGKPSITVLTDDMDNL